MTALVSRFARETSTKSQTSGDALGAALASAAQKAVANAGKNAASISAVLLFVETEWDVLNRAGLKACNATLTAFADAVTAARGTPVALSELRLLARPLIDLGHASGFESGAARLGAACKPLPRHLCESFYDEADGEEDADGGGAPAAKGKKSGASSEAVTKKAKKAASSSAKSSDAALPSSEDEGPELNEDTAKMLLESLLEEAENMDDAEAADELRGLLDSLGFAGPQPKDSDALPAPVRAKKKKSSKISKVAPKAARK
jgi:hypothetical protein